MKNIDIKSVIIGVLGTALLFVSIDFINQSKNLGDITVNSITVVDESGETVGLLKSIQNSGIFSLSKAGKPPTVLLICEDLGGTINTLNSDGKKTSYLGSAESGDGYLRTYNSDGNLTSYLGTEAEGGSGFLTTYNSAGLKTGYFGTNKDNDGVAVLFDRYGDIGWVAEGKQ